METLSKDRCDKRFELFWWFNLMNKKTDVDVAEPKLLRKRKLPDFLS